jgi:hypothetical protein
VVDVDPGVTGSREEHRSALFVVASNSVDDGKGSDSLEKVMINASHSYISRNRKPRTYMNKIIGLALSEGTRKSASGTIFSRPEKH